MAERLIDATLIIRALQDEEYYGADMEYPILLLQNAQTIDARPIIHAHWECTQWYEYQCSNCGDFALLNDRNIDCKSNYCPHCGAKMDEKEGVNNG